MRLLGNRADRFFDLHSEFACRCKDQRARSLAFALVAKCNDLLENRQAECSGFARAGLSNTQNIAAFQLMRNGLCLNRLWFGHASGFNALKQNARDTQSGKAAGVFANSFDSQFNLFRRHRLIAVRFKISDKRNLPKGNFVMIRRDAGKHRSTCAAVPETSRVSPALRPF